MAAPNAKKTEEKITKPVRSVHIVIYACPNCGEELEELKLCRECKSPMKVIQVVEKFGNEAEQYLADLKKSGVWTDETVSPRKDDLNDGGISEDDVDELNIPINGLHPKRVLNDDDSTSDDAVLGEIFPDDGEGEHVKTAGVDDDFESILNKLDEEEDTTDLEGIPEL
ncbi:MAG TPA: hypothetical protein VHA74_01030 [Candidatus Dojkabacteria bacterium]|nr:hypothetical protein [Candidatus Dojkabacteria bacterium]